ncbi:hypothetical protein PC129_g15244 [Phytophthora cactorum]|uniref:Uncharacterized protein n=1 Tax=Phytophthora cactorum TaxID=29920 RepID=A0A8T1HNN6_9STRA|nr:hypothetical protein PC112_g16796 [Phytophthora cactorum]KAG2810432.1 hypothetical protein PC111_g15663 [Phytophthora cactorum]KAG2850402.1 hypothetical protein PC113_g16821 [Phytophthora cactorum]KAG2888470.1 hypothetical protein PC114_g18400 [Phytophthora cactorum]KAG2900499.1 hypothetical protein PC115_g16184 [Phytophthora cactorum]
MEHQDNVARLISEMPRVRSPRRRTIEIQEAPHAAPVFKPLAKPLVFRKTKRELEREQQQAQALQQLERMQSKKRRMEETRESINRARPKCAPKEGSKYFSTFSTGIDRRHGAGGAGGDGRCVLAKMPFIQELFDLKPKKPSAHEEKSISFQDRYQAYKRKRHATRIS